MITIKMIKNILSGKWQIYDEDNENRYVYYTQMSLTYSYDEWYFYNEEKSFKFSEYKKTWWVERK